MTKQNLLRFAALVVTIFMVSTAVLLGEEFYRRQRLDGAMNHYDAAVLTLHQHGVTDRVHSLLENLGLPPNTVAVLVRQTRGASDPDFILAANPPAFVGQDYALRFNQFRNDRNLWTVERGRLIAGPDGSEYNLVVMLQFDARTRHLASFGFLGGAILSWLAIAFFVLWDARMKGSKASLAWMALCLVTGPAGIAAWLIARQSREQVGERCPGCGSDLPHGSAYCVRCGHAVKPTCPGCHHQVEIDWTYCGACGTPLAEAE